MALAILAAVASGAASQTAASSGTATINAVAAPVLGVGVSPEGTLGGEGSNVPYAVTREQLGDRVIVTVAPR